MLHDASQTEHFSKFLVGTENLVILGAPSNVPIYRKNLAMALVACLVDMDDLEEFDRDTLFVTGSMSRIQCKQILNFVYTAISNATFFSQGILVVCYSEEDLEMCVRKGDLTRTLAIHHKQRNGSYPITTQGASADRLILHDAPKNSTPFIQDYLVIFLCLKQTSSLFLCENDEDVSFWKNLLATDQKINTV